MTAQVQTLHVGNLDDKVSKNELRRTLYEYFTQFGLVTDVVAVKSERGRGQAFVVFDDVVIADSARRATEGKMLYGKRMRVQFARSNSFAVDPAQRAERDKNRTADLASAAAGGAKRPRS